MWLPQEELVCTVPSAGGCRDVQIAARDFIAPFERERDFGQKWNQRHKQPPPSSAPFPRITLSVQDLVGCRSGHSPPANYVRVGDNYLVYRNLSDWLAHSRATLLLRYQRSRHLRSAYENRPALPYTLSPPCVEGQAHRSLTQL